MKTHKFDAVSFLSGLIFTAFGLLFLIPSQTDDLIDYITGLGGWIWPVLLLGIGVAILIPVITTLNEDNAGDEAELESIQTG
ncbi:MAG TPA: hypothetical protein VIW94_11035 [Acidimicrobiia bacterium]